MRRRPVPLSSSPALLGLLLSVSLLGCLTKVEPKAGAEGAECRIDKNCREGLACVRGTCQGPDASRLDATMPPDTGTADAFVSEEDVPAAQPDGSEADSDGPVPDAPGSSDTRPADTNHPDTPLCNGGCCSNADCPLDRPVCNNANQCTGCKTDDDCKGRSLTVCQISTGACVQCTDKATAVARTRPATPPRISAWAVPVAATARVSARVAAPAGPASR
mgnify:CR=1 FL=1